MKKRWTNTCEFLIEILIVYEKVEAYMKQV